MDPTNFAPDDRAFRAYPLTGEAKKLCRIAPLGRGFIL